MHLLFYDGECGFCDHAVQFVFKRDTRIQFQFAPLQGETAARMLKDLPAQYKGLDSLILIENYGTPQAKTYVLGQGAFRILWLLGGPWKLLGSLSYLPPFLYNWGYRLIASNRHHLFDQSWCLRPDDSQKSRFLP